MSQEILDKLFESPTKVRLLRLFLRNDQTGFTVGQAALKIQSDKKSVQRILNNLTDIGLLEKKNVTKKRVKNERKYYVLNRDFEFYSELKNLVLKSSPASKDKILDNLKKIGAVKLAVLSGVFANLDNNRVDILIIADNFNEKRLANFLKSLEAEVGKEIQYALLSNKEFQYRYGMFDRFIFDILESPHEKIINKLEVE